MKAGRLIYALAQLSERERVLLLLLSVVAIPVAVMFLAVLPLLEARDVARRTAFEADAMLVWVSGQVRALPAEGNTSERPTAVTADPIGISGIEDSLVRIGLRTQVSQLANRSEGGVELSLEAAPFDMLGDWLAAMTPVWGYAIAAFRVETVSAGLVNATFELEAAE